MCSKIQLSEIFQSLRKRAKQIVQEQRSAARPMGDMDLKRLADKVEVQSAELELLKKRLRRRTQELEQSRNDCADLFQSAPVAFVIVNSGGIIEQVNTAAAKMLAGSDGLLVGQRFDNYVHPDDKPAYFAYTQELALHSVATPCELRLVGTREGCVHVTLAAAANKPDHAGSCLQWRLSLVDITERKHAKQALQDSQQRYRLAATAGRIGAYSRHLQSGIDYWSPEFLDIYGYGPDQTLPLSDGIPAAVHPDDRRRVLAEALARIDRKTAPEYSSEHRIILPSGDVRWVMIRGRLEFDLQGRPLRSHGIAMDITEHKQADEELLKSRLRLEAALQIARLGIWEYNPDTSVTMLDDRCCAIFGLEKRAMTNKEVFDRIHPEDRTRVEGEVLAALTCEDSGGYDTEYRIIVPDGTHRWVAVCGNGIWSGEGIGRKVVQFIGTAKDITEYKLAEENLQASTSRLIEAQRIAKVGDWEWDPDKGTIFWSKAVYDIFGRNPALAPPTHQEHPRYYKTDSWARLERALKAALESGKCYELELEHIRENDTCGWHIAKGEVLRDNAGRITKLRGTAQDISERKNMEETLLRRERQFRALVAASSESLYRMSPDWSEMRQLQGQGFLADTQTSDPNWMQKYIHPDDQPQVTAVISAAIQAQSTFNFEHRVRRADGSLGWTHSRAVPLLDENGELVEWFGAASDITERKKAEESLRHLNETLEQQVADRTQLAESRARQLQSLAVELIEAEERERKRIAELLHEDLQQILASARLQLQAAGANAPPASMLESVERLLAASIEKSRSLSHELSPAILNHSDLITALRSLPLRMAEQFGLFVKLKTSGRLPSVNTPIKVFVFRAVQELLFNVVKHAGVKSAQIAFSATEKDIAVTVSDDGQGFAPTILDTAVVKSGLGLLSLRERASYIGGHLFIESAPGQGSRITLMIPLALASVDGPQPPIGEYPPSIASDSLHAGEIWVLIVDDHKIMRQGLVKLMSRSPGIRVVGQADSVREAMTLVSQYKPDLIIIDVSRSDMYGIEATRLLKAELPDARVIGLSMFEDEKLARAMREAGAEGLVSKTASSDSLLKAIYGSDRDD